MAGEPPVGRRTLVAVRHTLCRNQTFCYNFLQNNFAKQQNNFAKQLNNFERFNTIYVALVNFEIYRCPSHCTVWYIINTISNSIKFFCRPKHTSESLSTFVQFPQRDFAWFYTACDFYTVQFCTVHVFLQLSYISYSMILLNLAQFYTARFRRPKHQSLSSVTQANCQGLLCLAIPFCDNSLHILTHSYTYMLYSYSLLWQLFVHLCTCKYCV